MSLLSARDYFRSLPDAKLRTFGSHKGRLSAFEVLVQALDTWDVSPSDSVYAKIEGLMADNKCIGNGESLKAMAKDLKQLKKALVPFQDVGGFLAQNEGIFSTPEEKGMFKK